MSKSPNAEHNDYYWTLGISADPDDQVHLKRDTRTYFVNNYNPALLKRWLANIDLQPINTYYKAVAYMAAYFSKSVQETSEVLRQAKGEIQSQKLKIKEVMYKLVYVFVNARVVSDQEVPYFCFPELWLRKLSPTVLYLNTNTPPKKLRILKSEKEISELLENSGKIYKSGLLEYYLVRPSQKIYIKNICFEIFFLPIILRLRKIKMIISQIILVTIH